jgi:hypothetical protein
MAISFVDEILGAAGAGYKQIIGLLGLHHIGQIGMSPDEGEMAMCRRGCHALTVLLIATAPVCAQFSQADALNDPTRFYFDYAALLRKEWNLSDAAATPSRTARLQMFRMPTGFYAIPLSLVPEDDPPPEDPYARPEDDFAGLQVVYGNYVPYLDMPRRGDPGGFGYYKVHSQMQLYDAASTNICLAVRALAPMGLQCGGVNGPTYFSPALACFHDLGEGTALHAFVGQDLAATARWRDQLHSSIRCGLAVQHPLLLMSNGGDQGLFVFVQALGQYRQDTYRNDLRSTSWEVIPGVQYRINSACWMSMGISRYQFMSCAWQY